MISWNTFAPAGKLRFRLRRGSEPASGWLDHAEWNEGRRRSLDPQNDDVTVKTDVLYARTAFDGIEVAADGVDFNLIAFASPLPQRASLPYGRDAMILDVPARSQYVVEGERGWCSPTSLSMLHAYHGIDIPVAQTAEHVFDSAYNGTGNWSFNVAYSGRLGLRGVVAYFDNLDRAQRLLERGLPVAISYSWNDGELPGAPLEQSEGHLAVLRGFSANGDCVVNDPAHPALRVVYPRAALESVWLRSGGVGYVVAPVGVAFSDALA